MCMQILKDLRACAQRELQSGILPFWIRYAPDEKNGGFYGSIANDLTVDGESPKGCVLNARILWTFSAAYTALGGESYLAMADRACEYFAGHFIDAEHAGVYWELGFRGNPLDMKKQTYAQAFAIYALSEYARAVGNEGSLRLAQGLFDAVEAHCHDEKNGGYIDAFERDWSALPDKRLSAVDINAEKTMNTHLHLLEAYTNLYRVWKSQLLKSRLEELAGLLSGPILNGEACGFDLFFDSAWRAMSRTDSFGHNIEGSWLLFEAAEALGETRLKGPTNGLAVSMAERVLSESFGPVYGGIYNERTEDGVDTDKIWWVQAEAVVGFLNAYALSLDERFLQAARGTWGFIENHLVDKENGEWFRQAPRGGGECPTGEKAGPWKCPYHNARMCLQVMERADALLKLGGEENAHGQAAVR